MEKKEARRLVAEDKASTPALLPAITVGCRRGAFEAAVMTLVANTRTLRTAAQGVHETTGSTLKYILSDVIRTGPSEAACVVVAEREEG